MLQCQLCGTTADSSVDGALHSPSAILYINIHYVQVINLCIISIILLFIICNMPLAFLNVEQINVINFSGVLVLMSVVLVYLRNVCFHTCY